MTPFITQFLDMDALTMIFAAIAAGATVLTLAMPLLSTDSLDKRMKAVALEREKMRLRERERLAQGSKVSLRQSPRMYMKSAVDNFNLRKWVGQEEAQAMLMQAGFRGQAPHHFTAHFRPRRVRRMGQCVFDIVHAIDAVIEDTGSVQHVEEPARPQLAEARINLEEFRTQLEHAAQAAFIRTL